MLVIKKTCENCEYEMEDCEGTHCRHCIHSAEEHFEPKKQIELYKEIRAKAIDEFVDKLINWKPQDEEYMSLHDVCYKIAEQLKGNEG